RSSSQTADVHNGPAGVAFLYIERREGERREGDIERREGAGYSSRLKRSRSLRPVSPSGPPRARMASLNSCQLARPILRRLRSKKKAQPSITRNPMTPRISDEAKDTSSSTSPSTNPKAAHLQLRPACRYSVVVLSW